MSNGIIDTHSGWTIESCMSGWAGISVIATGPDMRRILIGWDFTQIEYELDRQVSDRFSQNRHLDFDLIPPTRSI
jgi:hypothetical protein